MAFPPVHHIAAALLGRETKTWTDSKGTVWQYDSDAAYVMAWWIVALIIWLAYFLTVYVVVLSVYCVKERRRTREGHSFRAGQPFWRAFCIASGLWFWIWAFEKCGCCAGRGGGGGGGGDRADGRRSSSSLGGLVGGGVSRKSMLDGYDSDQLESGRGGPAWYGASAYQQQQYLGQGRFEAMGYAGSGGVYQHPYQQRPLTGVVPVQQGRYEAAPRRHSFSAELH